MNDFPKPSAMMRLRRPYLYSDSVETDSYRLSESEFRHHLDTLTDRNQHKDFENFCRKLAERSLCPNLRPQTGPEGGGDGKVDTETFPVDGDVTERWYVGSGSSGKEKWGFAFSAKKTWKTKVADDMEGIASTGRHYDRVIFITSRPARQADRLAVEQSLSDKHGIQVTILDQAWIVDQVFTHGYKDLAFDHLKAGEHEPEKVEIGPNDFKRRQALTEIEAMIEALGTDQGDRTQLVSAAFEAARLSRELERPRIETDGRFERAIRVASKYGTTSQRLRAVYEHAWTAVWWHDDIDAMLQRYDEVEAIAFPTDAAEHVSNVCNLHQVLVAQVIQGHASPDDRGLPERTERLRGKLSALAADTLRPNNALYAETLAAFLELNQGAVARREPDWDALWLSISSIIDRAKGLGEFPADLIDTVVEALSDLVPESDSFDRLVEQLAEFMAERSKELKAGEMYLTQGTRKLEREKPIEGIKWLGRAVVNLAKAESRELQAEALYLISVGYRSAGLLWAARSTALASAIQYAALSEIEGDLRVELIPAMQQLRLICVQLGHVVDALAAHQYLHAVSSRMPLEDASRERVRNGNVEFDHLLACLLTVQAQDDIARLFRLPDVLENLALSGSRIMLLHRLGHAQVLRDEGSIPPQTKNEELDAMLQAAAAQPATEDLSKRLVLFDDRFASVRTRVLGVDVEIVTENSRDGFIEAETYAAALEGLVATMLNIRVFPHVERFTIAAGRSPDLAAGFVEEGPGNSIRVTVPAHWSMTDPSSLKEFNPHLIETTVAAVMGMAVLENPVGTIEDLVEREQIFERATSFCHSGIARQRLLGAPAGQLTSWEHWMRSEYRMAPDAPEAPFTGAQRRGAEASGGEKKTSGGAPSDDRVDSEIQSHSDMAVRSVVDKKLWDTAHWQGLAYGHTGDVDGIPVLALVFEDEAAANAIFDDWLARFGDFDENEQIRVSVIKGIDKANPLHYRGHITQSLDGLADTGAKRFVNLSRMTTMTVNSQFALESFIEQVRVSGCYLLVPVVAVPTGQPEMKLEKAIMKRRFFSRFAWEVGPNDIDAMAVRLDDDPIIPHGVEDAPVAALKEWRRERGQASAGK